MKALSIAAIVTAALVLALAPAIGMIYGEAYPDDGNKRAALTACGLADSGFSRLRAEDRARCYARFLQTPPADRPRVPRHEQIVDLGLASS